MVTIQKYVRAQSLDEAYTLNQNKRNSIVGGMMWMRLGRGNVNTAIDLCDLGLNTIEETADSFVIGAMTTLRDIEQHEGLNKYTNGAIKNAVKDTQLEKAVALLSSPKEVKTEKKSSGNESASL